MAPRRPPCPDCGVTSFEEDDGRLFCSNGHQQEGGPLTGEDDGDYGTAGKVNRMRSTKEKQKISRIYRGRKGYQLYLKAWQFILWKQCYALVHDLGVPDDLWTVVKELWTLRLSQLTNRLEEELAGKDEASHHSTGSDSEVDVENEKLLDPLKTIKVAGDHPTLSDTVALNYLGILILRLPIRMTEIYNYVREERICYIRAIRHVPHDIRIRLAPEYHAALDTSNIPEQEKLQSAVLQITTMYSTTFGMLVPTLNWAPMLYQQIRRLSLPLEIFPAVKYIASIVKYDFGYQSSYHERRNATMFPEAQLMALVVLSTKLLFPFDNESPKRYPYSTNEPAAIQVDWTKWAEKHSQDSKTSENVCAIAPGKEIEVTDTDVMNMSAEALDQYMDWFQRTYTKQSQSEDLRAKIVDMFPLPNIPDTNKTGETNYQEIDDRITERQVATQESLKPRRAIFQEEAETAHVDVLRPGQRYQQYRSIQDLSGPSRIFHTEAADMACLNLDTLLKAVLRSERLLLLHQRAMRRAEVFEDNEAI